MENLSGWSNFWFSRFSGLILALDARMPSIRETLQQSNDNPNSIKYIADYFGGLVTAQIANLLLVPILGIAFKLPALTIGALVILGAFLVVALVYAAILGDMGSKSSAHNKQVNKDFPNSLNFFVSLSTAGVLPTEIFRLIGEQQHVYPALSVECKLISRGIFIFNQDLVGVLKERADKTRCTVWKQFLYGSINTIQAGGDLKQYFLAQKSAASENALRKELAFQDTLGIISESYIISVAAAPLFIVILLTSLVLINSSIALIPMLYLLAGAILPVMQGAFAFILKNMEAS